MIYHLALLRDLDSAGPSGSYRVSSLGRTLDDEGFVHASYAGQLAGVAARHYAGVTDPLVLLEIDESRLAAPIRVENGFPHVYGPIPLDAVARTVAVDRAPDGSLRLPDLG